MEILLIVTFCLIIAGTDTVTTVTGYRGRSVQINCSYDSGYEEHIKYLCRGECPYVGYRDIPVESGSPAKDSRFSLYNNITAKVFTVTITDLRPEDQNTYWCGVRQAGTDVYTEIRLLVNADASATSTVSHTTHATSTHSMSTSLHTESTHSTTELSIIIITAVSVVLVLLLFVLLFTVFYSLKRKKKIQVSGSSLVQPVRSSSNRQVVPYPDYEEIRVSRHQPSSVSSEIYSNTGLPTVPSDYTQAVYTTIDHPSDPPDQDFYSIAQLPTIPSDSSLSAAPPSVVESGESLTYAAVSFDTRSNAAAPTVIYKHENTACEYATVNKNRHC